MSGEMDEEIQRERKQSVKDYASKVFKETSVSAVTAIVSTGNNKRKIFRVFVFLIFTAGFLCQCIKFLHYVLQYPTIVNIEIERPDRYLAPAFTFCNFNPVKRSKFCSKYPDKCYEPDEEFCETYPKFCVENNTKVPLEDVSKYLRDPKDVMELIHDGDELLAHAYEPIEGPLPRMDFNGFGTAACYSLYSRVNSHLYPKYVTKSIWKSSAHWLILYPKETEVLYPNSEPGIVFTVHSPFEAVNPFENGIFMKPGHLYHIPVQMMKEELLPYPYKTDCINYTDLWLKANRTGPRSQEMCRHRCLLDFTVNCFNCTHIFILYPSSEKEFCNFDPGLTQDSATEECKDWIEYITPCINSCKEDCSRMKYSYQVQEVVSKKYDSHNDTSKLERKILVKVQFEDSEIMKIQYKAQFQQVETFSYIGGFIGIWLGVSLVQVADVIESFFLIGRYFFKKGSIRCSKKPDTKT